MYENVWLNDVEWTVIHSLMGSHLRSHMPGGKWIMTRMSDEVPISALTVEALFRLPAKQQL